MQHSCIIRFAFKAQTMTTLRSLVSTLSIAICLAASWPCTAKESVSQDDLSAQKELLQAKLDANKELQQKDLEAIHKRIDALDKRLDDQFSRVSDIGSAVDRFGILVTVLLAAAGLAGYVSVVAKSRREAKETSETWFEQNSEKLGLEIHNLAQKASRAHGEIDESVNNVKKHEDQVIAQAKETSERLQKNFSAQTDQSPTPISPADAEILKQGSDALKNQPESHYSYDDWNTRAFTAISENKLDDAAYYFGKAYEVSTQAQQVAISLYNKGTALGQLGRNQEAIDTYEALIAQLGDDPTPAIRNQVAMAIFNKGVIHGQMGDNEKEIATYEQLIGTYSPDPSPALREQVAMAMVNKGICLGEMGDHGKAIVTYEQAIDTYGRDQSPALHEQVARAMVSKGINLGKMGDLSKEIAAYERAIDTYGPSPSLALREQVTRAMVSKGFALLLAAKALLAKSDNSQADKLLLKGETELQGALERKPREAIALGNLAYIQWLLKRPAESEATFRTALTEKDNGGEHLYKGTLDDIAQHPIPEDSDFRKMVERLWVEYQSKQAPSV